MTTIKLEHVSKRIKQMTILEDITLQMSSGTVTGFSGANGSGKTMLMRMIAGLVIPTAGSITINEKIMGRDMEFPESIGILIEGPAFLHGYSGLHNLEILAGIHNRIGQTQIREVLEKVGLNPDDKKIYKKYSLGMKQRLGIAAAIMEKPEIIILDEPTNALDKSGVEMLKRVVEEERTRGAAVILSCHDTNILEQMSDEIYYLEGGILK